jgi:hypothetical protein
MSAVVEFVSDAFDAVGDVFEAVGDVVESVVDAVGDVVEKVGDTVQAVIDDPLPTLLAIGGSFVGIPPWVTMGAVTAARGGDLADIALSMGTAYIGAEIAPSISNSISSTVSSTFIEAGINETVSQLAGDAISKGLVNGTITEIRGGDFEDGFAGGFTGTLVAGGVGEVADFVKPDIVDFAMDSGLDLRDATAVYNAGVRAVSAGVTSELTGRNDFVTSFTNSAIGSGVDAGVRSFNNTIDQQFNTAATSWNETSDDGEKVDTAVVGAGIPDVLVGEVAVSNIGVDTTASNSTFDSASVLGDTLNAVADAGNTVTANADEIDDGAPTPEGTVTVSQAPVGQTAADFEDLISKTGATSDDEVLADTSLNLSSDFEEVAQVLPTDEDAEVAVAPITDGVPTGALASVSDALKTSDLLDSSKQSTAVVSDAPVAENLLTAGLAQDKPEGGLNAVSTAPQDKMTASLGIKPTDFTKPLVATVGTLIKQGLTQQKRPAPRPTRPTRPAGGLQTASVKPRIATPPPARMDVAKLMPIKKAVPVKKPTVGGPPKTLAGTANLSPVSNIAGLTSLVKKVG